MAVLCIFHTLKSTLCTQWRMFTVMKVVMQVVMKVCEVGRLLVGGTCRACAVEWPCQLERGWDLLIGRASETARLSPLAPAPFSADTENMN